MYISAWLYTHLVIVNPYLLLEKFERELDMPLVRSTSKKAFSKNVAAEVRAGKPAKQAEAIAYNEKREASKKKAKK